MLRFPTKFLGAACSTALFFGFAAVAAPVSAESYAAKLPMVFEGDQGLYFSRAGRYTLHLAPGEVSFSEHGRNFMRMALEGGNSQAVLSGEQLQQSYSNYYVGRDPKKWRTHVPHFGQVRYRGVYPGIDLVFHGNQRQVEYDFVVAPGADPNRIALTFSGVASVRVERGDLILQTKAGELRQIAPVVYQDINGKRQTIPGKYVRKGKDRIGFELARYDRAQPLVIDPILSYSTYLGGSNNDLARAVAVDGSGGVFLAGTTQSANFPSTGTPSRGVDPLGDAFVVKLNSSGTSLAYSTYFGGSSFDDTHAIAIDVAGNVYAAGTTTSNNFPVTAGAYKSSNLNGYSDSFVVKLTTSGQISYATYLAGNGSTPVANGIAVDASGRAYVGGYVGYQYGSTTSAYPTTAGAYQTTSKGLTDGFVTVLNPAGSGAVYSTLLGGTGNDLINSLTLSSSGNVIVTGSSYTNTNSVTDYPTTAGTVQPVANVGSEAFVTQLNSTGTALVYSTFLGGSGADVGYAVVSDSADNVYVTGTTQSTDFPVTPSAYQTLAGSGFVTKLNPTATQLLYSTYFSTAGYSYCDSYSYGLKGCEGGSAIAIDGQGNAYIVGNTSKSNFPTTPGALQTTTNNSYYYSSSQEAFFLRLNAAGNFVDYSTLFGGSGADYASGVALDSSGNVYLAGTTNSANLPVTSDAVQAASGTPLTTNNSSAYYDAFLARISMQPGSCSFLVSPNTVSLAATATTGSLAITTPAGCPWSGYISSYFYLSDYWLTLASTSGVGSGTLNYSATLNYSNSPRNLTLTVAGQSISVNQSGLPCTYTIQPTALDVPSSGGVGNVRLFTPTGCTWSVSSGADWVRVNVVTSNNGSNSTTGGSGDGSVQYSVLPNTGSTSRSAAISIGDQAFTITQAAPNCTFSLSPGSASVSAAGGTGSVALTTSTGCAWSAISSAAWLTPGVSSGTGSATVSYSAAANATTANRTATLTIAGQAFTVTQPTSVLPTLTLTADNPLFNTYSAFSVSSTLASLTRNLTLTASTGAVSYTVAVSGSPLFVQASRSSGTTPATIGLTISPVGLTPGTYTNVVTFTAGGSSITHTVSLTVLSASGNSAKVGVFRPTGLLLVDTNGDGICCSGDLIGIYGGLGDVPLSGDWTGTGVKRFGVYRPSNGQFILDADGDGAAGQTERTFTKPSSIPLGVPVVGDWTGTGVERVGVFRDGVWYLDSRGDGTFQGRAFLGQAGDIPLVGNWDGAGTKSKVGIYRPTSVNGQPGNFFLVDSNGDGQYTSADLPLFFLGQLGDLPVVGDWSGDGKTKVGIFRPAGATGTNPGLFILDQNGNFAWDGPGIDRALYFAPYLSGLTTSTTIQTGDMPITGNWVPSYTPSAAGTATGQGKTRTGIYRSSTGTFFLDATADGTYQGRAFLGQAGDIPVGVPAISGGVVVGVNQMGNY